jgi:RNA polymerase sigma-54 factor
MAAFEMGYELGLKQVQKLVMTPRLQQALRLLQMPMAQLEQVIEEEIMENPILETQAEAPTDGDDREKSSEAPERQSQDAPSSEEKARDEVDWDRFFDSDQPRGRWEREAPSDDDREPIIASKVGLRDQLVGQLRLSRLMPEHMTIGEYLIGSIDDDGYLRSTTPEEVAEELDVSVAEVEHVRSVLRQLDPVGIGSLDLRESLLSQLEAEGGRGSLAWRIVEDHLDDLMRKRFPKLAIQLGCTQEEIQEAALRIAQLDPKSGARYSSEDPLFVIPDLIVEEIDGEYVVWVNDRHLPRLRISQTYQDIMTGGANDEAKSYIGGKLNAARWLIKTIEQRRRTMVKVMSYIVDVQREFFDKGERYLRPLTLQEVADGVGMHESTISRVTSGKYVQTPRGIFELKYFFGGGLRRRDGEAVSVKTVKHVIKELIEKEDTARPLSDEKIAADLRRKGYEIARRTVTKYREQMAILPARLRQYKTN